MKFIVSSSSLLKHLQQISGVINTNTVLPILEDFLFEIEDKKLNIVATDLETVMRVQMDVESKANGRVCIPAKILIDSLKNIADQPLTFNIDKNYGVEITSDNGNSYPCLYNCQYAMFFRHGAASALFMGHGVELPRSSCQHPRTRPCKG